MQIRPISCQTFKGFDRGFDELNRKRKDDDRECERDDRENHAIYETASIGEKCDKIIKQNEKIIEQNSELNNTLKIQNRLVVRVGETLSKQVHDGSITYVSDGAYEKARNTFNDISKTVIK